MLLGARFRHSGALEDIDHSIDALQRAISLLPDDYFDKSAYLNNIGISFSIRFDHQGKLADIEQAIDAQERAVKLALEDHADMPLYLSSLGNSFVRRFECHGNLADIERALTLQSRAVELTPNDHVSKPQYLNNLGASHFCHFEHFGELANIERAIRVQQHAVELVSDDHPKKPMYLSNLGVSFLSRFERCGELSDIDSAVDAQQRAVESTPDDHAHKPRCLDNLGSVLFTRFERLSKSVDMDGAIAAHQHALELTPDDHADKPRYLSNFANSVSHFERRGEKVTNVPSAINIQQRALKITPDDHADKPMYLNNLGSSFIDRFKCHGELADIQSAIDVQQQALELIPDEHANKPVILSNLGVSFKTRFKHCGDMSDFEHASSAYERAAKSMVGTPSVRYSAAVQWAHLCFEAPCLSSALNAYRIALELIPQVVWLGYGVQRRYEELSDLGDTVNAAAAVAISTGDTGLALEWLEEGRNIVWSQILHLRTPVDELYMKNTELAERLQMASRALANAAGRSSRKFNPSTELSRHKSLQDEVSEHHSLALEYSRILSEVRMLDGFENFLLPQKLNELARAAHNGPVAVINVHTTRCDALVLSLSGSVLLVPLSEFSYVTAKKLQSDLFSSLQRANFRDRKSRPVLIDRVAPIPFPSILANLWTLVVNPILSVLKDTFGLYKTDCGMPHITWCATGPLAFLPLHAAGSDDNSRLFNIVVSSYTPSLRALLKSEPGPDSANLSTPPTILAVSQPSTHGQKPLPNTIIEVESIQQCIADRVPFTWLNDKNATVAAVLTAMDAHNWVHLACHGGQNAKDRTKSAFFLHNGELELEALMQKSLKNAELAILSACQTATGDEMLPEEAVHLAAGMLTVGYQSVIATMWSIWDEDAPILVKALYSSLLGEGSFGRVDAAYALHDAVKHLRDKIGEEKFERWVPFVHFGM
ncbi:hypothetical protein K435DRAFT_653833 [Dendrothele bispora CBS 962.96]|uniref:CHAT domain-containing protein n=1 Tax=Dendrothele bispora (strain CBS 962.96) TaxID=1314807 RepID=A0A4S8MHN9_DENBC|nr:hypothetical protein K435DRAFT_653833 [Dendrothele bispora CBS 962.96]